LTNRWHALPWRCLRERVTHFPPAVTPATLRSSLKLTVAAALKVKEIVALRFLLSVDGESFKLLNLTPLAVPPLDVGAL
jgi:hypothetical protein